MFHPYEVTLVIAHTRNFIWRDFPADGKQVRYQSGYNRKIVLKNNNASFNLHAWDKLALMMRFNSAFS